MATDKIEVVVSKVVERVKKPYVVTFVDDGDRTNSITFSLDCWQGHHKPEPGQLVVLTGVRRFRDGLRAASAAPILPVQKVPIGTRRRKSNASYPRRENR